MNTRLVSFFGAFFLPLFISQAAPVPNVVPLTFSTTYSGAISYPGKQDRLTFTGTAGQRLYYDTLDLTNQSLMVRLTAPSGAEIYGDYYSAFENSPFYLNESGLYTLTVLGSGNATGSYNFRLLDAGAASVVTTNVPVSATLNPSSQSQVYRFNGTAGQRFYLSSLSSSTNTANWTLLDPANNTVANYAPITSDLGTNLLPMTGTYLIVVQGLDSAGPAVNFQFAVTNVSDTPVTASGFGTVNSGTVAAGATNSYTFTASAGTVVLYDSLTNNASGTAYWQIVDPYGNQVFENYTYDDSAPLLLPWSGTYTINIIGVVSSDYIFRMVNCSTAPLITYGNTNSGALAPAFGVSAYRFQGTPGQQIFYEAFATNSQYVALAIFNPSLANIYYYGAISSDFGIQPLGSGIHYLLISSGSADPTASYNFSLIDLAQPPAVPLPLNTFVTNTLDPGTKAAFYTFSGTNGQRLFFNGLSANSAAYVYLYDPLGNQVTYANSASDFVVTLSRTGIYTLGVFGTVPDPTEYAFRVITAVSTNYSLALGAITSGTITSVGQEDHYTFTGTAGQRLFFNSLVTNATGLNLRLLDPQGAIVNLNGAVDNNAGPFTLAQSGPYTLVVGGLNRNIGAYSFRLIDIAQAPALPLNYNQFYNGSNDVSEGVVIYRFNGSPGQRLFVDGELSDSASLYFYDSENVYYTSFGIGQNFDGPVLSKNGTNLIILYPSTANLFGYSFRVLTPATVTNSLALNTVVSNTINGAGDEHWFTFTGTAGQRIYYDALENDTSPNITVQIIDPNGNSIAGSPWSYTDAGVFTLTASGTYTLIQHNSSDGPASYRFRLLDLASQPTLTLGTPVTNQLALGSQSQFYLLNGTAGQTINLHSLFADSGSAYWYLLNPYNATLAGPAAINSDLGNVYLPVTGTYAIWVNGLGSDSNVLNYQFIATDASAVSPPSGVVAWWPAEGSAVDIVGGNNGTLNGGVIFTNGEVGQAFSFDGSSGEVSVPHNSTWDFGSGNFTIEFWANYATDGGGSTSALVASDNGGGGQNKWILFQNYIGGLTFHLNGSSSANIGNVAFSPNANQWYHIAVTRSGSTWTFYTNGAVAGTDVNSSSVPATTAPLSIGNAEGQFYFGGALDEVRIYSRALSSNEVAAIYDAGNTGQKPPLSGFDTEYTGTVTPYGTNSITFSAPAGTAISFDDLTNTVLDFRIIDDNGQTLTGPYGYVSHVGGYFDDQVTILHTSGTYTLQIVDPNGAGGAYDFKLLNLATDSLPLTLGTTNSSSMTNSFGVQFYKFNITAGQRVLYDGLDTNTGTYAWLYGPDGTAIFGGYYYGGPEYAAGGDYGPMTLTKPGTYYYAIWNGLATTNDYTFRLLDLNQPPAVPTTLGTTNNGTLDPYETRIFSFTAGAGDLFFNSFQSANAAWYYYPPNSDNYATYGGNLGDFQYSSPVAGTNYVILYNSSGDPQPYSFRVIAPAPFTNAITLGSSYTNTLSTGQEGYYTFNATAGQKIYFDSLVAQVGNTYVRLTSPSGVVLFGDAYSYYDEGPLTLSESGTYTLRFHNNISTPTDVSFRVLDVASQPVLSFDATNSATVAPGTMAQLFQINSPATLNLFFHDLGSSNSASWYLYNPLNQALTGTTLGYDFQYLKTPETATYLLIISGVATDSFGYDFQVIPGNHPPAIANIGNQSVDELSNLTVTVSATDMESNNDQLTYSLDTAPPGASINPTTGVISWTPQQTNSPLIYPTTVRVTDDGIPSMSTTQNLSISVIEINDPPTPTAVSTQTVNELTLLTVTNSATNFNIHSTNYGFGLVNPIPGMSIGANGIFTWTPQQTNSPATNLVSVIVTNGNPYDLVSPRLTATNTFTLIVKEVNVAPSLPTVSTQTVSELTLLTVNNTATNFNIHSTNTGYGLLSAPPGMTINSSGVITWTPQQTNSPSTNIVTTVVTNGNPYDLLNPHLTSTNTFTVIVREVNVSPSLPTISTQTVNELTLLTVTNTATNSNIHSVITGYGLINPIPGMTINASGVFTWTPQQTNSPATNIVTTVVTNSNPYDTVNPQLTSTNTFTVIVKEVNVSPSLPTVSTQTVNELTLLTVNNTATNANIHSTNTSYTLVSAPPGMSISSSGVITWTPQQTNSPSTNTVTTVVTNGNPYDLLNPHLTATNTFTVIVKEVNVAPSLPTVSTQTVNELTLLTVTNTASESNIHSTITGYGLVNPVAGMSISTNGIFTWTPQQTNSPGTNIVTTVVTNSNPYDSVNPQLTATNTFTVIVKEVNVSPSLPTVSTQTVNELTLLTVNNTATNANIHSTNTSYTLVSAPPGMSISSSGVITWTPQQTNSPSTNIVTTVVTNGNPYDTVNPQLTSTNTFTVIVKEVNVSPSLPTVSTQTVNELTLLTVNNTATNANIHSTNTSYTLVSAPPGMSISSSGVITWTPQQTNSPSTNLVTTVVTNGNPYDATSPHLTATNTFTVIVKEANVAPSLPTVSTQTVNELTLLTVTNTASESNIHSTITGYGLINPVAGMSISTNGIFTWTPQQTNSPGTNIVTTVVTNSNPYDSVNPQLTATNTFTVIVKEVNVSPSLPTVSTQMVNELTLLTVNNTATNANIHSTNTSYTLVSAPPGMSISSSGVITWTPQQTNSPSTNLVTTVVTNGNPYDATSPHLTATNTFTVIVVEVNVAPTLPTIPNQTINNQATLTVTNTATESNIHSTVGYSLVNPPSGMTISAAGVITWTPTQGQSTNTITTVATNTNNYDMVNPHLTATNTFTVIVYSPSLAAITNRTTNPGQTVSLTATATDNDSTRTLTFSLPTAPSGATIGASSGAFSWRPPASSAGTSNYVQVRVSDNSTPAVTDTKSFAILVNSLSPVVLTPISYTNGQFKMSVSGSSGPDYVLTTSTNLTQWIDVQTNASPTPPFQFVNTNAAPKTFYRVRLSP